MRKPPLTAWIEIALLGTGLALLGYCVVQLTEAGIFQFWQSRRLERATRSWDGRRTAPTAARWIPRPHEVLGRLDAPRIHLSTIVLEGADSHSLRLGAGHIPGTALPGGAGNVCVAAHRDTFFRKLRHIAPRDEIEVTTPAGRFRYQVTSTEIVLPRAVSVLDAKSAPELTLITCYPFTYIGPSPRRFIVHARLVG